MNFRDIKTDHQAKAAAKDLRVELIQGDKWVALGHGKAVWACKAVYALRGWLSQ